LGGADQQNAKATDAQSNIYESGALYGKGSGLLLGTSGLPNDDGHSKKRRYFKVDPEKRNKLIMWTVTD